MPPLVDGIGPSHQITDSDDGARRRQSAL